MLRKLAVHPTGLATVTFGNQERVEQRSLRTLTSLGLLHRACSPILLPESSYR